MATLRQPGTPAPEHMREIEPDTEPDPLDPASPPSSPLQVHKAWFLSHGGAILAAREAQECRHRQQIDHHSDQVPGNHRA